MDRPKSSYVFGNGKLNFTVSIILICLLMVFLLNKLTEIRNSIEVQNVETEMKYLRLGLAEMWLTRNIAHKNTNISAFENTNPMLLIAERPENYIGELAHAPQDAKSVWFFDTHSNQLVYVFNNGKKHYFRLVKSQFGSKINRMPTGGLDLVQVD
jgi:hypothetical protein